MIAFNADKSLSDTLTDTITVYPSPISSFSTSTENGCSPLVVDFTNSSSGGTAFKWNFGNSDQSMLKNPVETFTNNTSFEISFNVKLLVINEYSCIDSTIKSVKVFPKVKSSFEADKLEGTTPLEIKFANNSNAIIYNWNFGDGTFSSLENPSHIFYNEFKKDTSFRVSLKVMNEYGCADSLSKTVKVLPNFTNVIELDQENTFSIYPNPAHNYLHIKSNRSIDFVDIIDYSGILVSEFTYHEAKNVTIAINSLKPGNYLIRYGNKSFQGFKKLRKNNRTH